MRIRTCDIEKPYSADYGVSMKFANKHGTFKTVHPEEERLVFFESYSWVGTSPGAIHVYGTLHTMSLDFKVLKSEDDYYKKGRIINVSGSFEKPKESEGFTLEIVRKLSAKEIKSDPRRWEKWNAGEYTDCYFVETTLKSAARRAFKKWFVDTETIKWKLVWR